MPREVDLYLTDILDAIENIEEDIEKPMIWSELHINPLYKHEAETGVFSYPLKIIPPGIHTMTLFSTGCVWMPLSKIS